MSPTVDNFNKRKNGLIINNNVINNNLINLRIHSIPNLEPVLEFDGRDDDMNDTNEENYDQIDGNIVSIASNIDITINDNININKLDKNEDLNNCNDKKRSFSKNGNHFNPTQALVRKQAPTFLLIESLIWSICTYYESERDKQKDLYLNLCQKLEKYKIIGNSYKSESLQPIRDLIVIKFKELVSNVRSGEELVNKLIIPSFSPNTNSNAILNTSHPINNSSRYKEEFIDLGLIEEGGFGIVNKAKHCFDGCEYAVKLIRFRYKTDTDFKKITREVQLYANLSSHPNVVAYKTAWLENWCLHQENIQMTQQNETQDNQILISSEIKKTNIVDDISIRFEESSKSGIRIERSEIKLTHTQTENYTIPELIDMSNDFTDDEEEDEEQEREDSQEFDLMSSNSDPGYNAFVHSSDESISDCQSVRSKRKKTISMSSTKSQSDSAVEYGHCNKLEKYRKPDIRVNNDLDPTHCPFACRNFGAILYIQMELCGKNLKTWLRERNDRIFASFEKSSSNSNNDILSHIDSKTSLNLFRQVLKGVEYIHSQHLIHRDLKPQNILFSIDESKVKLGDFGLATLHNSIDNEEILLHCYKRNPRTSVIDENVHTEGIGTSIYAAPEQKLGNNYDNKTDLYSLGIILFELFYPLSTDMEKVKCVSDITNNRKLPKKFQKRWSVVSEIILKLTNPNPALRPHASQVLQSSLFLSKEQQMIKLLEEQLKSVRIESERKDKEIDRLNSVLVLKKQEITEKDNEIENLKSKIEHNSN